MMRRRLSRIGPHVLAAAAAAAALAACGAQPYPQPAEAPPPPPADEPLLGGFDAAPAPPPLPAYAPPPAPAEAPPPPPASSGPVIIAMEPIPNPPEPAPRAERRRARPATEAAPRRRAAPAQRAAPARRAEAAPPRTARPRVAQVQPTPRRAAPQPAAKAPAAPAAPRATPAAPNVKVAPAPAPKLAQTAPPAQPKLAPAPALKPAAPPATATSPSPGQASPLSDRASQLAALEAALGEVIRDQAKLVVPDRFTANQPAEVVLTIPASFAEKLRQEAATNGLANEATSVNLTSILSGDGFAVSPDAAQAQPLTPGRATEFRWSVTAQPGAHGPLHAEIGADLMGAGSDLLNLGSVEASTGGGFFVAPRVIGAAILALIALVVIAWLMRRDGAPPRPNRMAQPRSRSRAKEPA